MMNTLCLSYVEGISKQGLSQDLSSLSFGQAVSWKTPPFWTGNNFYGEFFNLTFWGVITKYFHEKTPSMTWLK